MKHKLEILLRICKEYKNVYIIGHFNPDPDCIASAEVLRLFLKSKNINVYTVLLGKIEKPNILTMVNVFNVELLEFELMEENNSSLYIYCDCQYKEGNTYSVKSNNIICIDHHNTTKNINYLWSCIDNTVGACSSLIFDMILTNGYVIDDLQSSMIYYGIQIDTQNLTRGVSSLDRNVFYLSSEKAKMEYIQILNSSNITIEELDKFKDFIANKVILGNCLISRVDCCEDNLLGSISDNLIGTKDINIVILYSKQKDCIKFSLRCMLKSIKASELIKFILYGIGNGGGHDELAGGRIPLVNIKDFKVSIDSIIYDRVNSFFKRAT